MYHLLVAFDKDAWSQPAYEYDRSRYLEFTEEGLRSRFDELTPEVIEQLKAFPALFTSEGDDELTRVGYLRRIAVRGHGVVIEYEFEESIPLFPFSRLKPLMVKLNIRGNELSRTHWSLKDEDLIGTLRGIGLVESTLVSFQPAIGRLEDMRFKVALSFAGENRQFVEEVARAVQKALGPGSVFYDNDFVAQLARPNLDTLLQQIYLEQSDLVVVFLCENYEKKEWCGLEWRAIREIIKRKEHRVMPMRFDHTKVQGLFSLDGYVDLKGRTPAQVAQLIVERVRINALPPLQSAIAGSAPSTAKDLPDVPLGPAPKANSAVAPPPFAERLPVPGCEAYFRAKSEPLGKYLFPGREPEAIWMHHNAAMFLRLVPNQAPDEEYSAQHLLTAAQRGGLWLMPLMSHGANSFRGPDGVGYFSGLDEALHSVQSMAYVFDTGQIWATDLWLLAASGNAFPLITIMQCLCVGLERYSTLLKNLGVEPPYRWIAGVDQVKGRKADGPNQLAALLSPGGHECMVPLIKESGMYDGVEPVTKTLRRLERQLYRKCGLEPPPEA